MNEYIGIAVMFLLAGGLAGLMVWLGSVLGEEEPHGREAGAFRVWSGAILPAMGRLAVKFYLTAILFILFDVELVFLYPWAVLYRRLGYVGLVEMGVFLGILMVGYVYARDNGALDWK